MERVILLSFVTAAISFTVSEAKLLRPLREAVKRKSAIGGDLLCCGYCTGHWVALALVAIYQVRLFNSWWLLDYALTVLVIAWLGGVQWALMCGLMARAGK
jgi:hypothetical protein